MIRNFKQYWRTLKRRNRLGLLLGMLLPIMALLGWHTTYTSLEEEVMRLLMSSSMMA